MENQELYEVCTLGAILTGKKTGKEYYESSKKKKKKEEKKVETLPENNFGTNYNTGEANTTAELIANTNTVSIKETTTLDDNKKITGATVTIAAGADTRKEDITKGKEIYNAKKEDLKNLANSFT
jgi:pyruvate/2-oxoglutarate dehydrogenase complex dihydrolipoamide dehydrogenase (E3) component